MPSQIPADLLHKYPAGPLGPDQCQFFRNSCQPCGHKFRPNEVVCPKCAVPRVRCGAKVLESTAACRSHTFRGVLSIYSLTSARLSEQAIAEVLEEDCRTVDTEVAVARLLLSNILADSAVSDRAKMGAVKDYLDVIAQRKKLESGDELQIKMDDRTAQAIRKRFKTLIASFTGALDVFVPDPAVRRQILDRVKLASKLVGRYSTTDQKLPPSLLPSPGVRLDPEADPEVLPEVPDA